ncbi:hypothetical protein BHM03_00014943 [Ensete ventricosum]|nr:hypothetical protein BHM03_00014943 [Ensete ventricosum]
MWGVAEAVATVVIASGEEEAMTSLMTLGVASPRAGETGKSKEEAEMSSPQVEGDVDGASMGGREVEWQWWFWEKDGSKGGAATSSPVEEQEMTTTGEEDAGDGSSVDGGNDQ